MCTMFHGMLMWHAAEQCKIVTCICMHIPAQVERNVQVEQRESDRKSSQDWVRGQKMHRQKRPRAHLDVQRCCGLVGVT